MTPCELGAAPLLSLSLAGARERLAVGGNGLKRMARGVVRRSGSLANALSSDSGGESTGEIGDSGLAEWKPRLRIADYPRLLDL